MFEAVGERHWTTCFETVRDCLKPGSNATLHIITLPGRRWNADRRRIDLIQN